MAKTKAIKMEGKDYEELTQYLDTLEHPPKMYKKGEIISGKIVALTEGEMIVDVGGRTEGVVSGKELRINGQKSNKKVGDDILVYVIKPENDKGQIELSVRRTGTARKWHDLKESMETNAPVKVKVIEANTGGVIVEIAGGQRGFIPSSQLNNDRINPGETYTTKEEATKKLQGKLAELIGTYLEVVVMEIDEQKNRVILSEKYVGAEEDLQLKQKTLSAIDVGSELEGQVTGVAPFGLFVTAGGLEGLVHLSEISWDKVSNPANFFNVGDKVQVQVIGINEGGKRIAYSIKRLQKDPWDEIVKKYKVGQVIKGEVTKVVDYGAFVRIDEGLNGLIHISELSDKLVKDPSEVVKEGDTVEVMVISMSKEERHLGLSMRRMKAAGKKKKGAKDEETTTESNEDLVDPASTEVAPEMQRLEDLLDEEEEEKAA